MTSQQFADVLLAHWQLLWPLPAAERIKRIDELRQDYQFEEQLRSVSREMAIMDDGDFDGFTPKEQAEAKAEMAIRDAWLAVTEACNLFKDPVARPFIMKQASDINSMRAKLDFLASAIDVTPSRSAA